MVCLIGTLLLLQCVILFYKKELQSMQLKLYPIRALVSIIAMITWIEAVKHLGSNESVLVNYLAPIITVIIASFTKDEPLKLLCIGSGIICYIIIFITLRTYIEFTNYGFSMALISACCYSIYEIIYKKQSIKEHFLIQVFYTFLFAAIFLLPFYIKHIFFITVADLIPLMLITILRIGTVVLLFLAIKLATLNYLAPVSYMKFPLMAILRFLFLDQSVEIYCWFAAALLTFINIFIIIEQKNINIKITTNYQKSYNPR